jgi:hypothetical protein
MDWKKNGACIIARNQRASSAQIIEERRPEFRILLLAVFSNYVYVAAYLVFFEALDQP